MRDDFSARTKRILSDRVGHRCSNPLCRKVTSGPGINRDKSTSIGEAAHIKAASPGGKRYDTNMTTEQRKSIENGIWLCRSCARLIDTDEEKYTVDLLNEWKDSAESEVRREIRSHNKYNIFDQDIKILEFLTVCLNRPAFMDNIYCEGNLEDMRAALEDTLVAFNTGQLRDREKNTIIIEGKGVSAIHNIIWRRKIDKIVDEIYALKRKVAMLEIHEHDKLHNGWYVFEDDRIAEDLNTSRRKILEDFSAVLRDAELPEIGFRNRKW